MTSELTQPEVEWKGFEPRAYELDWDKGWNLPLKNHETGEATTVGGVAQAFWKIDEITGEREQTGMVMYLDLHHVGPSLEIRSDSRKVEIGTPEYREMRVSGPWIHMFLLTLYFWCYRHGINPVDLRCYPFDSRSEDGVDGYAFFLVAQDNIKEVVSLLNLKDGSFDPSLLKPAYADPPYLPGPDEEVWSAATDVYFYRKFYSENHIGQRMVLRPDKPKIYDSEDIKRSYDLSGYEP